jgi:glycosyltransferase involved in cell wall biosynthesis
MACSGLRGDPALLVVTSHTEWIEAISSLWRDPATRDDFGRRARTWVVNEHRWERTAQDALHTLRGLSGQIGKSCEGDRTNLREQGRPVGNRAAKIYVNPTAVLETAPSVLDLAEQDTPCVRVLFAKHTLAYPRASGHDIRTYNMIRALRRLGCDVALATVNTPSAQAIDGLGLGWMTTLSRSRRAADTRSLATLQMRFASYFGVSEAQMVAVAEAAREFQADVVVGVGADILPYMALTEVPRVWYAGDEWVSHYSSLAKLTQVSTWRHLVTAAVWGLYQRAFARDLHRIWVVSGREQRHMQRWAGTERVDALPNGVDAEYFAPQRGRERPHSAIFWGRLDFQPNLQALRWFCNAIWPKLKQRFPDSEFRIVGFNAGADARELASVPGVVLSPDVGDLRPLVHEHAVVVMPFQSGGGIKNKLLEAASMGKAIVCTPIACGGLRGDPPLVSAGSAHEWIEAIAELWADPAARGRLGDDARAWAVREHSWERTARDAVKTLPVCVAGAR